MRTFTLKGLFVTAVFMVLGCLAIHAADGNLITKQITIKLEKAGTLPSKIGDTKKYKITNLKIMGEINGTDLCFIREMAGSNDIGQGTNGKLVTLDLSGSKIVKGGDCYYRVDNGYSTYYYYYTSDDVIGAYAFKNCSDLTSLTLPSSVTRIGDYAFYNCSGLTSLALPSSVTAIGGSAFEGCSGLTSIYVSWESPLSIAASTFKDANTEKCILYVPKGTYDDYWLSNWGIFANIVEYDATGIDHITTSGEAKEISRYAADGQRLEVPAKGLNIVKYSDGSVKKVVVQ